jgi:3D-(3,5/4)-trihydroxycyclohexane-1,2-dione acylhydrolase (decyclizing)
LRLTVGQAVVKFLVAQYSERDGVRHRFFAGCWGIFGHGNVSGIGQALLEASAELRYYQARNEQAMVHASVGYARMKDRLQAFACTSSIGPGATNMVTGAALATVNRIPVLLLPGDVFATRAAGPVLQELEDPRSQDVSVNDCLRPVSRYFDRIWRPEQLPAALLQAMRVLTDPAETGAVTIALPQDTAAEAHDWPDALFDDRVWRIPRPATPPRRCGGWPSRPASRWRRPRRARGRCRSTIRPRSVRSARPGPRPPTPSPARPTWSSG